MEPIPQKELQDLAEQTGIDLSILQNWAKDGFLRKVEMPQPTNTRDDLDRQVHVD
jgi:predicted site-specific integrase-resolvase